VQHTVVDADSDPPSGEVEPDRVLPPGKGEQAGGVDGPLAFDRGAVLVRCGADWWRLRRFPAIGEQVVQLGGAEPGRDGFEADTAEHQMDHGGVGPQAALLP
jgi:hypothetical protein